MALGLLFSFPAVAQLTSEFYLDKTIFAPGEPVLLNITITNTGTSPIPIGVNQDQPSCSGISIVASSDPPENSSCYSFANRVCNENGGASPSVTLQSGESYTARLPLNLGHEINAPGDYWVEADYRSGLKLSQNNAFTKLNFRVDRDLPPLKHVDYQPWLDQLQSPSLDKRLEAARTLAGVAPRALQHTLIGFTLDPEFSQYGFIALHRLNSQTSRNALAALANNSASDSYEQAEAILYLALSNDSYYYPTLLSVAEKTHQYQSYAYAATLGGEKILPVLLKLEKQPRMKLDAAYAFGNTGSRLAVRPLIDLLRGANPGEAANIQYPLQTLTHRMLPKPADSLINPRDAYLKWSRWWKTEGATAPTYKPSQCGELTPLL